MNFKKRLHFLLLFILFVPSLVFAYSDNIILGGENIGISVDTKHVMIVGFYKVDDNYIGKDAGLSIGDLITKVNDIEVLSIDDMVSEINKSIELGKIKISYIRDDVENNAILNLVKDNNGLYKTGIYVKDSINGIGTLTYIDPTTLIFGALGHEITEKNTFRKVDIKDGKIFKSEVTGVTPSTNGTPGSKEAKLYSDSVYGNILSNTESGIYGSIIDNKFDGKLIEVANKNEVKLGKAIIKTVLDGNKKEDFEINIIDIDKNNFTKNILFEITDENLLSKTGGIVAGMSGSPIIQNDKIIGAVTHVVVNDTKKGYGIFITTMLEEGDKSS